MSGPGIAKPCQSPGSAMENIISNEQGINESIVNNQQTSVILKIIT